MISSMTGFGHFEIEENGYKITTEIKSVNHRYLDLNIKLPRKFNAYESHVRNIIKEKLGRGKVDIYITYEAAADKLQSLVYNEQIASDYISNIRSLAERFDLDCGFTAYEIARLPEVFEFTNNSEDEDELERLLTSSVQGCLEVFSDTRRSEGARLAEDLSEKLNYMAELIDRLEELSPVIIDEYQERLKAKIAELLGDEHIDESRIASEVVIYADRVCIDEEMVRLKSHVQEMKADLDKDNIGRKLDFIAQEMNREANTILSKSTDSRVASIGIELKTLVEKVREQVQNIE